MANRDPEGDTAAIEQWYMIQGVLALTIMMSVLMPLMWGWTRPASHGGLGWISIIQSFGITSIFCLVVGELIRRWINSNLCKPLCRWVWQK